MSALEVEPPREGLTGLEVAQAPAASGRFALSLRERRVVLAIADDGGGLDEIPSAGTGLSIVRALVRDELRGTIELTSGPGTRAEVVFPAV